jgi:hypothetical protein
VNQVIRARWWRVPAEEVPRGVSHETQLTWLYDWWKQIDTWISGHRPPLGTPETAVAAEAAVAGPVTPAGAPAPQSELAVPDPTEEAGPVPG